MNTPLVELIKIRDWVSARRGQMEKLVGTGQSLTMIEKGEVLDMLNEAITRASTPASSAAQGAGLLQVAEQMYRALCEELAAYDEPIHHVKAAVETFQAWEANARDSVRKESLLTQPSDATAQPSKIDQYMEASQAIQGCEYAPRVDLTDELPQPYACAVSLLETFAEGGMIAFYEDGTPTPNRTLCIDTANEIRALLANTAQGKPRNFCEDCGKRTPECSIHTCSPAWQVEQADKMKMKG